MGLLGEVWTPRGLFERRQSTWKWETWGILRFRVVDRLVARVRVPKSRSGRERGSTPMPRPRNAVGLTTERRTPVLPRGDGNRIRGWVQKAVDDVSLGALFIRIVLRGVKWLGSLPPTTSSDQINRPPKPQSQSHTPTTSQDPSVSNLNTSSSP